MARKHDPGDIPAMTIDVVTAALLARRLGSRRRAFALLTLAGMDPLAQRGLAYLTGAPVEFVPTGREGVVRVAVTVEIATGIGWRDGVLMARPGTIPQTIALALIGRRVDALLEHPDVPGDMILAVLANDAPEAGVVAVADVPTMDVSADVLALISAWFTLRTAGWRANRGREDATPIWIRLLDLLAGADSSDDLHGKLHRHLAAETERRGY